MAAAPQPPTTRDVADAAGVHQTTVSLALRNHPRIPLATRQRIQAIAEKLGYRHDPRLTELMHHLRSRRSQRQAEVLAYVSDARTRPIWHARGAFFQQLTGAKQQAEALGFRLDEFWLNHDGLTARRLDRVLRSRGIRGILLGPISDQACLRDFSWNHYAAVALNHSLREPEFHRVGSDHAQGVSSTLEALSARDFLRIGLIQSPEQDLRMRHAWTTAYHGFCARQAQLVPVPICFADYENDHVETAAQTVLSWFRGHRPEVVLTTATDWRWTLARAGYVCPRDYSYVLLDRHSYRGFENAAGVDQQHPQIGAIAVNKVADCITRAEFGLPAAPTVTLLKARFVDGDTLSPVAPAVRLDVETPKIPRRRSATRR